MMSTGRIRSALWWATVALVLASCGGGDPTQTTQGAGEPPADPGEATVYEFELSGYAPTSSGASSQSYQFASLSQPAESNLVTVQGQLLPVPDGADDGRVYNFAVRINEREASVVEAVDLPPNLPGGVYDFYVILQNRSTGDTYGGLVTSQIITDVEGASRNVVYFTLYPVLEPISSVRDFRALTQSTSAVTLYYDPARLGPTRPKLSVTLADGTQLTWVINPDAAIPEACGGQPCVILFLATSSDPVHQFFYGDVSIVAPTDGSATNDPTPVLQYTIDDPCFAAGTCNETVLVGGTSVSTRDGGELPSLNDGSHTVRVIFTDQDGNTQEFQLSFLVDATPPTVVVQDSGGGGSGGTIQDGGTLGSDSGDVNVSTDEGSTVTLYLDPDTTCKDALDAGDASLCDGFLTDSQSVDGGQVLTSALSGLAPGLHQLYIVAVDGLGNQSVEVVTFTVVDSTAPGVQIGQPTDTWHDSRTVPFDYTLSDDVTPVSELTVTVLVEQYDPAGDVWNTVSHSVDGTAGTLTVNTVAGPAGDGRFRVTVSATNATPLTGSATREFRVDTVWPELAIVQPADGSTVYTHTPPLEVESTEDNLFQTRIFLVEGHVAAPVKGIDYGDADRLDIAIDGSLQWPNGDALTDGDYTVIVELTDVVGHMASASSRFTVNAAAPFVQIINPDDGATITNGKVNLKFNAHDASHVEIWVSGTLNPDPAEPEFVQVIDPVQPVPKTYEHTLELPVDDTYTIRAVAKDTALPAVQSEDTVQVIVDSHRPSVDITDPAGDTAYAQPGNLVNLSFQASDATGYEVLLGRDVVAADALDGTPVVVTLPLGPFAVDAVHTVTVQVSDGQSRSTDSFTLVVDGTLPVVTIRSPEDGDVLRHAEATLLYSIAEANGIQSQTVWLNSVEQPGVRSGDTLHGLLVGQNVVEVQATDRAGNASVPAIVTFFYEPDDGGDDHGRRRGRASCIRTPVSGDHAALHDLLKCVRSHRSGNHGHDH